jgi:hypothetical protein
MADGHTAERMAKHMAERMAGPTVRFMGIKNAQLSKVDYLSNANGSSSCYFLQPRGTVQPHTHAHTPRTDHVRRFLVFVI